MGWKHPRTSSAAGRSLTDREEAKSGEHSEEALGSRSTGGTGEAWDNATDRWNRLATQAWWRAPLRLRFDRYRCDLAKHLQNTSISHVVQRCGTMVWHNAVPSVPRLKQDLWCASDRHRARTRHRFPRSTDASSVSLPVWPIPFVRACLDTAPPRAAWLSAQSRRGCAAPRGCIHHAVFGIMAV